MELRQLKYFVVVAEELHFGRAAQRLHLSQPALSKQIRALENNLGVLLLERTKHWVKLTPAGQKLLETAHRILQETEQGIKLVQQIGKGEIGHLKIGFTTPALYSVVPEVLGFYRARFPSVELILTGMGTEEQVEALCTHQIDLGFLSPPVREKSLALHTVFEGTYLVALPASHPLANQKQISLSSLIDEPIIFYPRSKGPVFYAQFLELCQQAGFTPNIVQEVEMTHTRLGMVAANLGIAFIASSLQNLTVTGVVYRTLVEDFPKLEIAVAWRKEENSSVVLKFIESIKIYLRSKSDLSEAK